jgi:PAS domain S-box-containing protein
VEDFTSAPNADDRQFLAFIVPTSESAAEMCILRGTWERKARPTILHFMQSVTPALTIILERLLNANRSQRLGEQLHTLANAAQMLTRSEDVETALRDLATAISASTGFEYIVNIDLYDATTNHFFLRVLSEQRYTGGTLGQFWGAGLNPDRLDPWNVDVMTTLQPVLRPDMQNDPVYPEHVRKFFAQSLLRSTADFPLLFQDEFLGTMAFVSFKPRTFPPDEVSLLQGFVAQAATAVKALQMHKEVERYAQELKKSADEYKATTNSTGDVICRLDKHGRWTFLNDAACQFYGKPREELLGTDSRVCAHPDDVELTAQVIRETRARKELARGFVNRQLTPRGTRVVEWNGYAFFDEDGQYAGVQITGRDISERKQMEDALAAKTQEYIDTANLTGVTILKLDKDGRVAFVNDATCQFLGRPKEEILGAQITDYLQPEDAAAGTQAIREMIKSKSPIMGLVSHYVTPMGTRVAEWNARPLFDEQGQYAGLDGTGRDITERKQMEEALQESEERFRLAINATKDGLWEWDIQTNQEFFSPRWCEIVGYSFDDPELPHTYTSWASRIHPDDYDRVVSAMNNHLEKGTKYDVDYQHRHKSGEYRWQNSKGQAILDETGKPIKMIGCISDISERKRAEEAFPGTERSQYHPDCGS